MQTFIKLFTFALLFLTACEKKDQMAYVSEPETGGTLSASALATSTLHLSTKTDTVTTFTWPAVDYGTPVAVTYTLQYDSAGTAFAEPFESVIGSAASLDVTQAMLNGYAIQSGVAAGQAGAVAFRIKSTIPGAPDMTVYSAPVTLNFTTYDEVVYWYVPGDYQGWSPASAPKLGSTDLDNYVGYIYVTPTGFPKFKITPNPDWSTAYGDGGSGKLSTSGGDIPWPAPMPASASVFYLTTKKSTLDYTIKPVKFMIAGDFNGWNNAVNELTYNANNIYTYTTNFTSGAFKIVIDGNWSGGDGTGALVIGGGENIPVTAGTHTVKVDMSNPPRYKVSVE